MSTKRWVVAAAAVVLAAATAAGWSVTAAGDALLDGRAALEDAEAALADRDLAAAGDALTRAERHLARGGRRLASPAAQPARLVPVLGRNVAAAQTMADAGAAASRAGADLLGELEERSDGLAALAARDGRLPVEAIAALADPLADARDTLAGAEQRVAAVPRGGLLGDVRTARDELAHRLGQAHDAVDAGAALAAQLPAFLGADGPRRYLVGAQNPAELRGTGGLIGAIGELVVDDGHVDVREFGSVGRLTRAAPDELTPPSEDFAARYARYGAVTHGSNVNMTPDVPTAAAALERLHAAVDGDPVDGTILADPVFFAALVELTGPVTVPGVGELAADDVVAFATREQYELLDDAPARKELLGDVAEEALRAFLRGTGDPRAALAALGEAAADGRLRIHAARDAEQAAFAAAGVDGSLADPSGDYLAVVGNNAAGHKGDQFYERRLEHVVRLRADGSAHATLSMRLANRAPTEGLHETVLGHRLDQPGDNRTIWSVYCAPGCAFGERRRDGDGAPVAVEHELGRPVSSVTAGLGAGEQTVLEWEWEIPEAWQPRDGDDGAANGRYELTIDGQPHLMESTTSVRVHPPAGHRLRAAPGSPLDTPPGGAGRYDSAVGDRVVLAADVVPTAQRRLTERVREVLNQPLAESLR